MVIMPALVVLLLLSGVAACGWQVHQWQCRYKIAKRLDTRRIRDTLAGDYVNVRGEFHPITPDDLVVAPFSGVPCVWYQVWITCRTRGEATVFDERDPRPCLLRDASGECLVLPEMADVRAGLQHRSWCPGRHPDKLPEPLARATGATPLEDLPRQAGTATARALGQGAAGSMGTAAAGTAAGAGAAAAGVSALTWLLDTDFTFHEMRIDPGAEGYAIGRVSMVGCDDDGDANVERLLTLFRQWRTDYIKEGEARPDRRWPNPKPKAIPRTESTAATAAVRWAHERGHVARGPMRVLGASDPAHLPAAVGLGNEEVAHRWWLLRKDAWMNGIRAGTGILFVVSLTWIGTFL